MWMALIFAPLMMLFTMMDCRVGLREKSGRER